MTQRYFRSHGTTHACLEQIEGQQSRRTLLILIHHELTKFFMPLSFDRLIKMFLCGCVVHLLCPIPASNKTKRVLWRSPSIATISKCYKIWHSGSFYFIFQRTSLWLAVTWTDDCNISSLNFCLSTCQLQMSHRGHRTWEWQITLHNNNRRPISNHLDRQITCIHVRVVWWSRHFKGRNLDSRTTTLKDHASRYVYYSGFFSFPDTRSVVGSIHGSRETPSRPSERALYNLEK